MRRALTPFTVASWCAEHALPASTSNFETVLKAMPVTRLIARRLLPFAENGDDLGALGGSELVHEGTMPRHALAVKHEFSLNVLNVACLASF